MKEKVTARNLWRGIYPILFFQGTAIVIQNILMITLSVMSANSKYTGISQYSDRVNKINLHAMEITLLTDIICIIIMAYFMYSDIVKDKLKGIYVKYDKVKWTKYLLVIPFAYFFMMSANALVSILTLYMPENMVGTYDNTKEILNKEIILIDEKIEELLSYKQNIMKRLDTINDELRNLKLYEIDLVYINKRKALELNANITKDEEFDFLIQKHCCYVRNSNVFVFYLLNPTTYRFATDKVPPNFYNINDDKIRRRYIES